MRTASLLAPLQVPTGKGRVINCLLAKAGEHLDFSPVCLNVLSWLARRRMEDWRTGELSTSVLVCYILAAQARDEGGLLGCSAGWRGAAWRTGARVRSWVC